MSVPESHGGGLQPWGWENVTEAEEGTGGGSGGRLLRPPRPPHPVPAGRPGPAAMAVSSSSGEGSLLEDLLEVEGAPAAAGGRTRPRDPAVAQALAARDLNAEGGPGRFAHVHGADAKAVVPGRLCSLCGQRPQPLGWEQEKTSALLFLRKRNRELEASNEALKENLGAWRGPAGERQRMHARAAATGDRAVAIFLRAWDRLRLQRAFAALLRYNGAI